jgi:hypothetical protein
MKTLVIEILKILALDPAAGVAIGVAILVACPPLIRQDSIVA